MPLGDMDLFYFIVRIFVFDVKIITVVSLYGQPYFMKAPLIVAVRSHHCLG